MSFADIIRTGGSSIGGAFVGNTAPQNPSKGMLWVDTSGTQPVLNYYDNGWAPVTANIDLTAYVKQSETAVASTANSIPRAGSNGQLDPAWIPTSIVDLSQYSKTSEVVLRTQVVDKSTGNAEAGSIVKLDANGKIDASMLSVGGGMSFKGTANPTSGSSPLAPAVGDFYVATVDGTGAAGWAGLNGVAILKGEAVIWDGTKWDIVGASVNAATVYSKTDSDARYYTKTAIDGKFNNAVSSTRGVIDKDRLIKLDSTGHIDPSMLPSSVAGANMTWKGYIDAEDKVAPTTVKLGDTYMLARAYAAASSQVLDVPPTTDPAVTTFMNNNPVAAAIIQQKHWMWWFPWTDYKKGDLVYVQADRSTFANSGSDAAFVAQAVRDVPGTARIMFIGSNYYWTILGPIPSRSDLAYLGYVLADSYDPARSYTAGDIIKLASGGYLQAKSDISSTKAGTALNPAQWNTPQPPAAIKYKTVLNSVDVKTSLAQFTPVTPGASWLGVAGQSLYSGTVIVWDGTEWVNISPRNGLFVTVDQYKAGASTGTGTGATTGAVSSNVTSEILKINDEITKFKTFVAQTYESKADLTTALGQERATSDGAYVGNVKYRQDQTDFYAYASKTYLSKSDAATSYATRIDLDNNVKKVVSDADAKYETKADAAAAHQAETSRADTAYVKVIDPINKSSGPTDVNKIPKLDLNGKIDASMLPAQTGGGAGGINFKGGLDPTQPAPATNAAGDFHFFLNGGALDASYAPLTGTANKGDAVIWDGTKWTLIPTVINLSAFYSKAEVDSLLLADRNAYTAGDAAERAYVATMYATIKQLTDATAAEISRADGKYLTQFDATRMLDQKYSKTDANAMFLSKNDASITYLSRTDYQTDLARLATQNDNKYETQVEAKRAHAAEVARADSTYTKLADFIDFSRGGLDGGKPVKLDATGQIDASMIRMPGGMLLKGSMIPGVTTAPNYPAAGWFYLVSSSGTMDTSWVGLNGVPVVQGDALIYDGSIWSRLKMSTDFTNFYTKAEANALFATSSTLTSQISAEVSRADSTYETKTDAAAARAALSTTLGARFLTQVQVAAEVAKESGRADGLFETKADAQTAHQSEVNRAEATYLKKTALTTSSAGSASSGQIPALDANGKLSQTFFDPTNYYSPAMAATATATEIARANAAYVAKADLRSTSGGAGDAGMIPRLDASGKIDNTFLKISGGVAYRGALDVVAGPAPVTPNTGDMYISSTKGVAAVGFVGIAGQAINANDILLWDGAKWDVLSTEVDVTAVNARVDTTNALITALTARVATLEALLANVTFTAAGSGLPNTWRFDGKVTMTDDYQTFVP